MYFVILRKHFFLSKWQAVSHFNSRELAKLDTVKSDIFKKGERSIELIHCNFDTQWHPINHFYVKTLCHSTYHRDSGLKCHCTWCHGHLYDVISMWSFFPYQMPFQQCISIGLVLFCIFLEKIFIAKLNCPNLLTPLCRHFKPSWRT